MSKRWWCLGALTLARAGMGFQFQSVAAVGPLISESLGLDKAQLGWLIGIYLLPGVAFALPGGMLGRRFGDKRLVLAGLILMAIGGIWLGFAGTVAAADAARFTSGIGAVSLNVLATKMVTDWFEGRERLLAMSILINAWPIGIGMALLLIGPLAQFSNWHWGVVSTSVFAAIGFAFVFAVYQAPPRLSQSTASGLGLAALTRSEWHLLMIGSLPWMLYNAASQITISFMPSFFVDNGFGIAGAGGLVALNMVVFVIGVQAGGILLKRAARSDLLCYGALAIWVVTLLLLTSSTQPLPWIILGGLIGGIPAAALVSLPGEFLRPDSRNAGIGVFYTVFYFGCAVLPFIAGWLYDHSGGRAALWMAAGLALCCVPVLLAFRWALKRATVAGSAR